MATIQIRDIPEEAYESLRRRARGEGRSIQAYMRDLVIEAAAAPTKVEVVAAIEKLLERFGGAEVSSAEIAEHVAADRR